MPRRIEYLTHQKAGTFGIRTTGSRHPVISEPDLNGVPKLGLNNRRMFARISISLVSSLAAVCAVLKHQIKGALRELLVAIGSAITAETLFAADAIGGELFL